MIRLTRAVIINIQQDIPDKQVDKSTANAIVSNKKNTL